jgi:hypothetical protein
MPPTAKKNVTAQDRLSIGNDPCYTHRERVAAADINAGYNLLNGVFGYKYRVSDLALISIGGAAAGATDVRVSGTQAGAVVDLAVAAVAGLTANTFLDFGNAGVAMLTAGGSLTEMDPNTPIVLRKTGAPLTGSTHVDVVIDYQLIQSRVGA